MENVSYIRGMNYRIALLGAILLTGMGTGCTSTSFLSKETLKIDSNPAGAEVWINNEQKGKTPLEIRLPSGDMYYVEIRREYFRPERVEVLSKLSDNGRSGVRVNPLVTRGYYSSLTPNPVEVNLVSTLIPEDPNAPKTWEEFSARLNQLYQLKKQGNITDGVFKVIHRQLIDFYDQ
jgi:hypothetical protein